MSEQQPEDQPRVDGDEPTVLGDGTDVSVDAGDIEREVPEGTTATSDATRYRDEGDTQGGTGGLDAGGAG
jgi:hypothetical protein